MGFSTNHGLLFLELAQVGHGGALFSIGLGRLFQGFDLRFELLGALELVRVDRFLALGAERGNRGVHVLHRILSRR